jgi:hypothetical protein
MLILRPKRDCRPRSSCVRWRPVVSATPTDRVHVEKADKDVDAVRKRSQRIGESVPPFCTAACCLRWIGQALMGTKAAAPLAMASPSACGCATAIINGDRCRSDRARRRVGFGVLATLRPTVTMRLLRSSGWLRKSVAGIRSFRRRRRSPRFTPIRATHGSPCLSASKTGRVRCEVLKCWHGAGRFSDHASAPRLGDGLIVATGPATAVSATRGASSLVWRAATDAEAV